MLIYQKVVASHEFLLTTLRSSADGNGVRGLKEAFSGYTAGKRRYHPTITLDRFSWSKITCAAPMKTFLSVRP